MKGLKDEYSESLFFRYWSKTSRAKIPNESVDHHLLVYHSFDVAAVTWHLLAPDGRRCEDIASFTGLPPRLVRYLATLAMMMHDFGKFSKAFQSLVPELFSRFFSQAKPKSYTERHDTLGFLLWRGDPGNASGSLKSVLREYSPPLVELLEPLIRASFGHHGLPPKESAQGGSSILRAASFFDSDDIMTAQLFLSQCLTVLGDPPDVPTETKRYKKSLKQISWMFAGLGVLADWIGSNIDFFPYVSEPLDLLSYWEETALSKAEQALSRIRWQSHRPGCFSESSTIASLFPFISQPTPLQECSATMKLSNGPQLFIVEDVTGAGKTEAATVLAARIMSSGAADGMYIGLPTMATANAMYERMKEAYRRLYTEGETPSLVLSHGVRHLSKEFSSTVVAHNQRDDLSYGEEETASAMCNSWYADNRKKALLADVGVGTIDQALLSVLPGRHQSVRLLGLHRKVLIVDEVHAYDPYMEHLLAVLLEAHARGGGSAILLSATIPLHRKRDLITAFLTGLSDDDTEQEARDESAYPLITRVGADGIDSYPLRTREEVQRSIKVEFVHSYEEAVELVESRALSGQCVCWIRNTVRDAGKSYRDIRTRNVVAPERVSLFHSRFAMVDRARIESETLTAFGKESDSVARNGRVLVATQVVEQSLDLDFDYIITDLAPIDLIIQRAGRLHRHVRDQHGNRAATPGSVDCRETPTIGIFAPIFDEEADASWLSGDFAGTGAVYRNPGVLWRTQKILSEKRGWRVPDDVRESIETVYGEDQAFEAPAGLDAKVFQAVGDDQSKKSMGHLNALVLGKGYCRNAVATDQWNEDERVSTRLTDETRELVLVVSENGKLVPYADVDAHFWDWSCLSISQRDWQRIGYTVPEEFQRQAEELTSNNRRLKYAEVVIVEKRSVDALLSEQPISDYYDCRLGWGKETPGEE